MEPEATLSKQTYSHGSEGRVTRGLFFSPWVQSGPCLTGPSGMLALGCIMLACLWGGCKSTSPSQYISPRVEGRVLDAQSRQPIKDVQVRRLAASENYRAEDPPKGGEMIKKAPAVRSAADGTFVMASVRDIAFLQTIGWYSISLSFQHPAYERFVTNYTLAKATNTANGEQLVRTGDILLTPLGR